MGVPSGASSSQKGSLDPVRVFIVDDQELVRHGLRSLLEGEGIEVVGDCAARREAGRRIVDGGTTVAVLKGPLPDGTGIEVCRDARSLNADLQCLLITSHVDEEVLSAIVLAGAAGYLLRTLRGRQIADTIRRAAAGESLLHPGALEQARAGLAKAQVDPIFDGLTPAEKTVLALAADGRTNPQISEAMVLTEQTVRELVSGLLPKLGFGDGSPAVEAPRTHHTP
ncbi:Transcriptional regulatory protein DevR (DosR) [Arthrobacter sp. SO5]|uniref:response regulator transcription factor n=1 Tax=Arthrobacter sp. SO5 TaxID=1897055 RepID=UPI0022B26598|nr:response regulator transcription factor [Arthrobacter sp. SO5]MCB5275940.1 Transcriptional regulatory protein DevR (DosR) [Arthrobacter sp. SO5]